MLAAMEMDSTTPTSRYRWLVENMANELGRGRGWKKRVAEQLRVHPSYISKLLSGAIEEVGIDVIDRAVGSLMLNRALFFDPTIDPSNATSWRSFQYVSEEPRGEGLRPRRVERLDVIAAGRLWQEVSSQADRIMRLDRSGLPINREDAMRLAHALWDLPVVKTTVLMLAIGSDTPTSREDVVRLAFEAKELELALKDADRHRQAEEQGAIERAAQKAARERKRERDDDST